jgi:hypothetical protein
MATLLRTYATPAAAHDAVDRMLAAGFSGEEIGLLEPRNVHDHRLDPVGSFAGRRPSPVRDFAGRRHSIREGCGTFAGDARVQRRGGFDDTDRETLTTYAGGVPHAHVVSHHEACSWLREAGLDVDESLAGHALVLLKGRAAAR